MHGFISGLSNLFHWSILYYIVYYIILYISVFVLVVYLMTVAL